MLNLACRNTAKLIREQSSAANVRIGRYFTKKEVARRMAATVALPTEKTACTVLDPGAGTGILSAALVERICREAPTCKQIFLTCYENNPLYVPVLADNLERIRKKCRHDYDVRLFFTVNEENYLTESHNHYTVTLGGKQEDRFDYILCNPPRELYAKASAEAVGAGGISEAKQSAAFLFLRLCAAHLEPLGELVILLPTAFATASSLTPLRREIHGALALEDVHLFLGKVKNEQRATPLKKDMILHYRNAPAPQTVSVTVSDTAGRVEALPALPYGLVVSEKDGTLTLPKSAEDTRILTFMSRMPETLSSLGLKIGTGAVLDARCRGCLFEKPQDAGTVPLFRPAAVRNGRVIFERSGQPRYLAPQTESQMIRNKTLLFIRRVPARSDARFLNAAVYIPAQMGMYRQIALHNKLVYIDTRRAAYEMRPQFAYGLFALLNSTVYERYLAIMTKSRQVNAKEMRALPLPAGNLIENIGARLLSLNSCSVEDCDMIVEQTFHIRKH